TWAPARCASAACWSARLARCAQRITRPVAPPADTAARTELMPRSVPLRRQQHSERSPRLTGPELNGYQAISLTRMRKLDASSGAVKAQRAIRVDEGPSPLPDLLLGGNGRGGSSRRGEPMARTTSSGRGCVSPSVRKVGDHMKSCPYDLANPYGHAQRGRPGC